MTTILVPVYEIEIHEGAEKELQRIRPYDRNRVLDEIEEQLSRDPATVSSRKKTLGALEPPWDQLGPVWQLRVGDYRVYYDVIEEEMLVIVRAVRKKPSHLTTEEIL